MQILYQNTYVFKRLNDFFKLVILTFDLYNEKRRENYNAFGIIENYLKEYLNRIL